MSEKSLFFDSVDGDRKYNSRDFTSYFSKVLTDGVFPSPSSNLQVISNGNLTVTVKAGGANIKGYLYSLDTEKVITLDVPNPTKDRKDIVVVRWDLIERNIKVLIKSDTVELERNDAIYELCLAEITVKRATSIVTQSDIYDTRQDNNMCGLVNSLIQADFTTLFNGFEDGFNTWFDDIKSQLGTDVAGNLLNKINTNDLNINKKVDDFIVTKGQVNGLATLDVDGVIEENTKSTKILRDETTFKSRVVIHSSAITANTYSGNTSGATWYRDEIIVKLNTSLYHTVKINVTATVEGQYSQNTLGGIGEAYVNIKNGNGLFGVEKGNLGALTESFELELGSKRFAKINNMDDWYRNVGSSSIDYAPLINGNNEIVFGCYKYICNGYNASSTMTFSITGIPK